MRSAGKLWPLCGLVQHTGATDSATDRATDSTTDSATDSATNPATDRPTDSAHCTVHRTTSTAHCTAHWTPVDASTTITTGANRQRASLKAIAGREVSKHQQVSALKTLALLQSSFATAAVLFTAWQAALFSDAALLETVLSAEAARHVHHS